MIIIESTLGFKKINEKLLDSKLEQEEYERIVKIMKNAKKNKK